MELVEGVVHVRDGADPGTEDVGDTDAGTERAGDTDVEGEGASDAGEVPVFMDVDAFVDRLAAVGDEHDCAVQALDARLVAGAAHVRAAVAHANRAWVRGEAVARDRAVEILLYAAGRRQINRAMRLGVEPGRTPAVVVVDADPGTDPAGPEASEPAATASDAHATDADATAVDPAEAAAAAAVRDLLESAPTLGETDEAAVREFFDVGERELAATTADLGALVRERVALLDVEK